MLFKNLSVYRFSNQWAISLGDLEAAVAQCPARECLYQEVEHFGFDYVHEKSRLRVWPMQNGQAYYLKITHHQRLLPSDVEKSAVRKKVEAKQKEQGSKLSAAAKREIAEQVRSELLQKAFQKSRCIQLILHIHEQEIWIDQSSDKKCELVLSILRRLLGSLPVRPLSEEGAIVEQLNHWLLNVDECPQGLSLGDTAKLVDSHDTKAQVTIKREDLAADEIRALLDGRQVVSLGVEIGGELTGQLTENRTLKSIKPLSKPVAPTEDESPDDIFDAEVYLSCADLLAARHCLKEWLGEATTTAEQAA